jgi:hypothetical protein
MLSQRMKDSLDRWITGNYGEDQFKDEGDPIGPLPDEEDEFCDEDCSKCKMKVNYTMFDQEDDGDIGPKPF